MSCQCAWCGDVLREPASESREVSHGICLSCAAEMLAELDGLPATGWESCNEEVAAFAVV
jgi:hypothetical protein